MSKVYKLQLIVVKLILVHTNKKIKNIYYNNYYINMFQKHFIMVKANKVEIKMKYVRKLLNYGKNTVIIRLILHI